jgi:hypothetical protein
MFTIEIAEIESAHCAISQIAVPWLLSMKSDRFTLHYLVEYAMIARIIKVFLTRYHNIS